MAEKHSYLDYPAEHVQDNEDRETMRAALDKEVGRNEGYARGTAKINAIRADGYRKNNKRTSRR